jgi:membrane protease YdiL (CAAX protease family)
VFVPLLYIMWRSGESFASFGLRHFRPIADSALSVAATLASLAAAWCSMFLFYGLDVGPSHNPVSDVSPLSSLADYAILVPAMAANAFAEELAMRSYVITRLNQFGMGGFGAIVVSAVLFGAYHIYQGVGPMLVVTIGGLVLGGLFVLTRRLWPLVFAHFVMDVLAYLQGAG